MDIRTTLTLNGRSYDVDLFDQCFYRLVGWRGNLLSHYPARWRPVCVDGGS